MPHRMPTWWQRGIIYHIYPRSFMDATGDGIGDLRGITARLDYLRDLGVDALWISPIYPSPMADFGYDVTDYTAVAPIFGTLDDLDALIREAHRRDLRVLLDWIPNHTSVEHPWFREARASRDNPRRDWYLWREPAPGGGPPTNWISVFGGSAWQWDDATDQYYYHTYLRDQADLNWRNPAVQDAMFATLRFWLDRGADGFRVDALRQLIKDDRYRDNPPNPAYRPGMDPYLSLIPLYTTNRPEVHDIVRFIRRTTDAYGDIPLIGELYLPISELVAYYGPAGSGIHLPTNFHLLTTPWRAADLRDLIAAYEAAVPATGWPDWILGNHDRHRVASRIGPGQARVAALLLLTLRGTPTLYYGDEIGMRDVPIPPGRVQDPFEKNIPGLGRDPERTPMPWDATPNAGFCPEGVQPWLPVADDYPAVNVAAEAADPHSSLTLYRRAIALRRASPALEMGPYTPVPMPAGSDLLAFLRTPPSSLPGRASDTSYLVVLNCDSQPQTFASTDISLSRGHIVLNTHLDRAGEPVAGVLTLRPDEGVIVALD